MNLIFLKKNVLPLVSALAANLQNLSRCIFKITRTIIMILLATTMELLYLFERFNRLLN